MGNANAQWKLGLRIADLRAKATPNGIFAGTNSHSATATPFTVVQKSTFLGAGPRFGVQGSTPLGRAWSVDWLAGAAVLVGERHLKVTASTPKPPRAVTTNYDENAAILNIDAQAGRSNWDQPDHENHRELSGRCLFQCVKNNKIGTANNSL